MISLFYFQSTSNYHARKYGVRAAMPGFIAKKLCPGLVIVPPNFDKYRAVSEEVRVVAKHTHTVNRWTQCTLKQMLLDSFAFSSQQVLMNLYFCVRSERFLQTMTLISNQWAWMKPIWILQTTWSRGRVGQSPVVRTAAAPTALPQVQDLIIQTPIAFDTFTVAVSHYHRKC